MDRSTIRQIRTMEIETRGTTPDDGKYIEGYFSVFGPEYELVPGWSEKIDPGAFERSLAENDIRCLINHDTSLVLGRNRAGTLTLETDAKGLYGRVKINEADSDAVNLYERVKRGDVSQCSFGFFIRDSQVDTTADGGYLETLTDIDLFEVSVCTFPAYKETGVEARAQAYRDEHIEARKKILKERTKTWH